MAEFNAFVEETKETKVTKKARKAPESTLAKEIMGGSREKLVASVMALAGAKSLPTVDELFRGRDGRRMRIRDIAVFLTDNPGEGQPGGEVLNELAQVMHLRNTVNLSTEVSLAQVKRVGVTVLEDGRVWSPISVTVLKDGSKNVECWSGRHRLVFLALAYGPDAEVPVTVEGLSTQEARNASIRANEARHVWTLERAEHEMLRATHGAAADSVDRDELYARMVRNRKTAVAYCITSTITMQTKGMKFEFPISPLRKARGNAVIAYAVESLFRTGVGEWNAEVKRADFDRMLKDIVTYANAIYAELKGREGFDAAQQMGSKAMQALGSLYQKLILAGSDGPAKFAGVIADKLMDIENVGTLKSAAILDKLVGHIKKVQKSE